MLESATIDSVTQDLKSEGYDVVVNPSGPALPAFLAEFRPDLIAYGSKDNVVVEFSRRGETSASRLALLGEAVRSTPGWRLRILRYSSATPPSLPVASVQTIRELVKNARVDGVDLRSAFVLHWMALEAAARLIDPREFAKPQTPGRVVRELAERGVIDSQEQESLETLVDKRNRLVHGDIDLTVDQDEIRLMGAVVDRVLMVADGPAAN